MSLTTAEKEKKVADQLYIDVVCLRAIMKGTPRLEEVISGIKNGEISLADSGQYSWEFESEEDRKLLGEAKDFFIKNEIKRKKKLTPEEFQSLHLAAHSKDISEICLARKDEAILAEIKFGKVTLERAEKLRVLAQSKEVANFCQKTEDKLIKFEMKKKISPERWSILYRMGGKEIKKIIAERLLAAAK